MKFLMVTSSTCIISFLISGVLFAFADFGDIKKDLMLGKYNFGNTFNMNINIIEEDDWVTKDFSFETSDISEIQIESVASELSIEEGSTGKIEVQVKMAHKKLEEFFQIKNEKKTLYVLDKKEEGQSFSSMFDGQTGSKIKILIPKGFNVSYRVKVALGDLDIKNISGEEFKLKVAAGDIDVSNVNFKIFVIDAAAGDIDIIASKFGKATIRAAAGDVDMEIDQEAPEVDISATAGDIDFSIVKGLKPNFTFKNSTTVGDLELKKGYVKKGNRYIYGKGEGSLNIKTTFGDIEIK